MNDKQKRSFFVILSKGKSDNILPGTLGWDYYVWFQHLSYISSKLSKLLKCNYSHLKLQRMFEHETRKNQV